MFSKQIDANVTHTLLVLSAAPCQEGPGLCFGQVGQRSAPHGQEGPGLDPPGSFVRRSGERLRPTPRRPVRPVHEESPLPARAGAREGVHKAQRQWTNVGCRGGIHQMKTPDSVGLKDPVLVCYLIGWRTSWGRPHFNETIFSGCGACLYIYFGWHFGGRPY